MFGHYKFLLERAFSQFSHIRMSLTPKAIQTIYSRPNDPNIRATLQVLSVSTLAGQPGRFKIVLSDGDHYTTGLLSSQLIARFGGCPFKQFQLVLLEEYMVNSVQDKLFILVHQMSEATSPLPGGQIGNPQVFRTIQQAAPAPAQVHAPPANAAQSLAKPAPVHQVPPQANYSNPYSSMPSYSPFAVGMAQPTPAPVQQNPYQGQTSGPVRYLQATDSVIPMNQLTIYTQKWTIKARVATKSDMRTYRNAKGEGQLMTIELVDQQKSEMRATFFGAAAQKFHAFLQVGSVYTFSKGSVKPANPRFNPKAQYELMFDEHSEIVPVKDDSSIPAMNVTLVPISSISQSEPGETVDVAGVALGVGEIVSVTIKASGRDTFKRTIVIGDDSGSSIELTIWGEKAERFGPETKECVILAKGCRVGDFNTRSLSTSGTSLVEIDPNHPRTPELRNWWNMAGKFQSFNALSGQSTGGSGGGLGGKSGGPRETIQSMRQEDVSSLTVANMGGNFTDMGFSKRTVNQHTIKAILTHIPMRDGNALYYKSCATEVDDGRGGRRLCQKKAEQQGEFYVCAEQHMNRQANARFILSMRIQDPTGECLVRAFHDESKNILGIDAADLDQAPDPPAAQQVVVEQALFKPFIFKIRSKKEIHMDEERLNMIVAAASPVNPSAEAHSMLSSIKQYLTRIGS
jgi:replication factor A1